MNKKIILFGLFLILFSSFTFAGKSWDTNAWTHYFDCDTNGSFLDGKGIMNGTIVGADFRLNGGQVFNAYQFPGAADEIIFPADSEGLMAFSFWTNQTIDGGALKQLGYFDGGVANKWFSKGGASAEMTDETFHLFFNDGADKHCTYIKDTSGGWTNIIINYNASVTRYNIFINGTKATQFECTGDDFFPVLSGGFDLELGGVSNPMDQSLDELAIFNESLTITQITDIYLQGRNGVALSNITSLFVSVDYPLNNTHYNLGQFEPSISYNGQINLTTNLDSNCSLNDTRWTLSLTGNLSHLFINNTGIIEGNYSIKYLCIEPSSNVTSNFWFIIDPVDPVITINDPVNNTHFHAEELPINITTFDTYLSRVNLTITEDLTGTVRYNNDSGLLPGNTIWYNITDLVNITNHTIWPTGNYTLFIEATDTHTQKKLKEKLDYKTKIKGNEKEQKYNLSNGEFGYLFPKKDKIEPIKSYDRFNFKHTGDLGWKHFFVTADKLDPLPLSPYNCHLIVNDKYAYDCEGLLYPTMTKITDTKYRIDYLQDKSEVITLSLVGLNQVNKTVVFSISHTMINLTIINGMDLEVLNGVNVTVDLTLNGTPLSSDWTTTGKIIFEDPGLGIYNITGSTTNYTTASTIINITSGIDNLVDLQLNRTGIIPIGIVFNPPNATFFYNITQSFTATSVGVNETCLFIEGSPSFDGTYCYSLNELFLDDIVVFFGATPVGCNANITNIVGDPIDISFEWFNRTDDIIKSGTAICEHNLICDTDTLQPSLIKFNDTISCGINITKSFFSFTSNRSNELNTSSIGACDSINNYTLINISFFDEVDDSPINVTNGYNLFFSDGLGVFNLTSNFTGLSFNEFCTDLDPATAVVNINLFGTMTLSKSSYTTRVITLPESDGILVSNNPHTNLSLFLIKIANSSTITFTWQTTEFEAINGVMKIERCNPDGSKSLIDSTLIANAKATSNLQLFTSAYSYSVIIGDETFTEPTYNICHVESTTSTSYFVDVNQIQILPVIGLLLVDCGLEEIATNIVKMEWEANPNDPSEIEGCMVAKRSTVNGLLEIFRNCSIGITGSFTRTIPDNGVDYVVTGEVTQNDITAECQDSITFTQIKPTAVLLGATGAFIMGLIIMALALRFSDKPENMIAGTVIGIVGTFILGISALSWETTTMMISFLIIILVVVRKTKTIQAN